MSSKAGVTERGAISLGRYVACDAFDEGRPLRIVTHAHSDHMLGLRQSLMRCESLVMTPATKDLIDVLMGPLFLMIGNVKSLDYGEPLGFKEETLELHYADHILGTAQVLVKDAEGTRILYTSDFRIRDTPVIEADVVVIEATYGNPTRVRKFDDNIEDVFVSLVEAGLKQGSVFVFSYHGKLQETMQILHEAGVRVPFVMPEKVFHVSKICERYGMRLGRFLLSTSEQGKAVLDDGGPCVAFYHIGSRKRVGEGAFCVCVSGWEFGSACRQIGEKEYVLALSDHSDFNGLLRYVEESKPKLVITDNFRAGDAQVLAQEIQKRLGIRSLSLPY
ncbi:MAG TPA: MBL fold metallo-hydrolase [Candidatus Bathyarchaeia archaeon]|nr:MBL fold metallo-hydrolase [Candidatus Bathyarchaeia archaeon]